MGEQGKDGPRWQSQSREIEIVEGELEQRTGVGLPQELHLGDLAGLDCWRRRRGADVIDGHPPSTTRTGSVVANTQSRHSRWIAVSVTLRPRATSSGASAARFRPSVASTVNTNASLLARK